MKRLLAGLGVLASVVAIVGFGVQAWEFFGAREQKRLRFDDAYDRSMNRIGSEFKSSHNFIVSVLPNSLPPSADDPRWGKISSLWNQHSARVEEFFGDLSKCLSEKECSPGEKRQEVCKLVDAQLRSHKWMHDEIEKVQGMNMNYTSGPSIFGDAFGPSVNVPNWPNLKQVSDLACR